MKQIAGELADLPLMQGLPAERLELISGCGQNRVVRAGEFLMREGEPADDFHLIRRGSASIEVHSPSGEALPIETLHDGDVAGWSWLVEPYRVHFDVRATSDCHLISFDGTCLRGRFTDDPQLGYELLRRFIPVIVDRLQATRLRLLDLYGH